MKKRLCLLFALMLLMMTMAVPAMATQTDDLTHIAGSTYFDERAGMYAYYADTLSGKLIHSNVADGMITAKPVSVKPDTGVAVEVYRNGNRLDSLSGGTFELPGEYVVMYLDSKISQQVFTFTIVAEVTNSVAAYDLPKGFEMTQVTLNGEATAYERDRVSLSQEGRYDIHYRCIKTDIPYQVTLTTDRTGPVLSLEEVTDGMAQGPVDISEAKDAALVNIYHDGQLTAHKDVLTESGEYYIELADEAGNKSTYSFTILIYFDGNSWIFIAIIVLAALAVMIYLIYSRKHLRVR